MNEQQTTMTEELRQLVERAEQAEQAVLPELKAALDGNPGLWRAYGDIAAAAEHNWLELTSGRNLMLMESAGRVLADCRDELAGPAASPLERLLARRVALDWLQAAYCDAHFAQLKNRFADPGKLRDAGHHQDRAHRRYLAAVKQLALVRKLLRPARSPLEVAGPDGAAPSLAHVN